VAFAATAALSVRRRADEAAFLEVDALQQVHVDVGGENIFTGEIRPLLGEAGGDACGMIRRGIISGAARVDAAARRES